MIRLFCGYDEREAIGFHVFAASVIRRATKPVSIIPLSSHGLPEGSNTFTLSRFLVPYLCGYQGHAIFADASDMLMLGDVAELDTLFDPQYAVQCVQHPNYQTRHPRKYVGTEMECENRNYERKNWASLMIFNCAHPSWSHVNPKTIPHVLPLCWLQFQTIKEIGDLPPQWNRLADEGHPTEDAKICHWTAGIPGFPAYVNAPAAESWHEQHARL